MRAEIGKKAPNLGVSEWVQGMPTNFDQEGDRIVVAEVFQVNCPGCFMYGIPEMIKIYEKYRDEGVRVLGLATAFEDFDKNTLDNLRLLLETGKVVGDTLDGLSRYGQLDGDRLRYKIPFPVGMDVLSRAQGEPDEKAMLEFVRPQIPDFDSRPPEYKAQIMARVREHMMAKEYSAETFEKFSLRGTPSTIVVDRKGVLRDVSFGQTGHIESLVRSLIDE